jgi:SHS2 domain-containing protein
MKKFIFLPHTADIKFRSYGRTLNEAFENAVLAVADILSKEQTIKSRKGKVIDVFGDDMESLLYNFLEEILYLLETENFVTAKAAVTMRGNNLKAELFGDDASNYSGLSHIKSPTYSEMYVKKTNAGWELQAVLDV